MINTCTRLPHPLCPQVERELPETAALMRLSGLEVADCVSELTGLGEDVSAGLRSTARMAAMAESSVRQGAQVSAGVDVSGACAVLLKAK